MFPNQDTGQESFTNNIPKEKIIEGSYLLILQIFVKKIYVYNFILWPVSQLGSVFGHMPRENFSFLLTHRMGSEILKNKTHDHAPCRYLHIFTYIRIYGYFSLSGTKNVHWYTVIDLQKNCDRTSSSSHRYQWNLPVSDFLCK